MDFVGNRISKYSIIPIPRPSQGLVPRLVQHTEDNGLVSRFYPQVKDDSFSLKYRNESNYLIFGIRILKNTLINYLSRKGGGGGVEQLVELFEN